MATMVVVIRWKVKLHVLIDFLLERTELALRWLLLTRVHIWVIVDQTLGGVVEKHTVLLLRHLLLI